MRHAIRTQIKMAVVALVAGIALTALEAAAQTAALQGTWRSGDTTIRVVFTMGQVRGTFATVGKAARELGFKPGDVSFTAVAVENYLHGVQTLRYGGTCYPNGRPVAMMARLTPDGRIMAIHTYAIRVDNLCRDTGEFSISENLWQRVQ
ncbi:MAG TPA: hypothetical protein VGT00_20470 [Methylomirabilota bacterium]|nr:hypothetical protein [Methylomirabilota bacterium]